MKWFLFVGLFPLSLLFAQESEELFTPSKDKEESAPFQVQAVKIPNKEPDKAATESFIVFNKKNGKVWVALPDTNKGLVLKPIPYLHDEKNGTAYSPIETGIVKAANIRMEEEMRKKAKMEALFKTRAKQQDSLVVK